MAELDSSFKYPDPSPGSLLDAGGLGSRLQVLLANIRSWSGWDPSGVGRGLCAHRTPAVPPTLTRQGRVRGSRPQSRGRPLQRGRPGPGPPAPAQPRLPARVDSEPGSRNQSDHFARFPGLPGGGGGGRLLGWVSPARPRPPPPLRCVHLPRGWAAKGHSPQPHSPGAAQRQNRRLEAPFPGAVASPRGVSCRPLRAPWTHRPRRQPPCGRLQSGSDTELSPRIEWLLRGGLRGVATGPQAGEARRPVRAAGWARAPQPVCAHTCCREDGCAPHVQPQLLSGSTPVGPDARVPPPCGDRPGAWGARGRRASASARWRACSAAALGCAATAAGAGREDGRRQRGRAGRGPREGQLAPRVEGAAAPSSVGGPQRLPLRGWGRQSPLCRVRRAEVRPVGCFSEPCPLPISVSLFGGQGEGSQHPQAVLVVWGVPPDQPPSPCPAVHLGRGRGGAARPRSTTRFGRRAVACLLGLGQVERFPENRVGVGRTGKRCWLLHPTSVEAVFFLKVLGAGLGQSQG